MKLWQRRAVRQMTFGVLPLVVIGVALILVLGVKANSISRELSPATATATGTVHADGVPAKGVDIDWTDAGNTAHSTHLEFPGVTGTVKAGTKVTIFYYPDDPNRAYAAGDTQDSHGREYASGVLFALLVFVVGVGVTLFRLRRRVVAGRRTATTYPVRWAQYRRGLIRRSWLVVSEGGREWWQPVYWEPGLASILSGTPAQVHGNPALDRLLVIEVDGMSVWPSGRRRPGQPQRKRGEWIEGSVQYSKTALKQREKDGGPELDNIPLWRHLLGDIVLVVPAPVLALVWAYIDGSGAVGFLIAVALLISVLFWLPSVLGSDPT